MEKNITDIFQWLLGVWKTVDGRAIYEEWRQKDEYTLEGLRYTLKNGEKQGQEKFNLVQRGGTIYYSIIASHTAAKPVELRMSFFGEQMAAFDNPAKTFPIFIRYKLTSKNLLQVIADGMRKDGKSYRLQYPFAKATFFRK